MKESPSETLKREFGEWLKSQREASRFSQQGAANRAGIDRQQWYRIENGLSGTKRDTVIAIAEALSLDPAKTLTRAGFAVTPNVEDEGLFSRLHKLTPERQQLAKRQIRFILESLADPKDDQEDVK